MEFFEPVAEQRGVGLTVSISPGAHTIRGDRDLCFEALSNLLDNALKFTPRGGVVRVGVDRSGGATVITVEDTGPGLPPAEHAKVFQRFYRAEVARRTSGNGLGLSLVAAIAKLHTATVTVRAGATGGCRFDLVFPSAEGSEAGAPSV